MKSLTADFAVRIPWQDQKTIRLPFFHPVVLFRVENMWSLFSRSPFNCFSPSKPLGLPASGHSRIVGSPHWLKDLISNSRSRKKLYFEFKSDI
jgi:hypothetical protein